MSYQLPRGKQRWTNRSETELILAEMRELGFPETDVAEENRRMNKVVDNGSGS